MRNSVKKYAKNFTYPVEERASSLLGFRLLYLIIYLMDYQLYDARDNNLPLKSFAINSIDDIIFRFSLLLGLS